MYTKNFIKFVLILTITATFFGCQDKNIESYNDISKKHQESIQQAFAELNNSITYYNNKEYKKAKQSAQNCQQLFSQTKAISQEAKSIAQDIKGKEWLADYKNYSIQSEDLRIKQCKLLYEVSITTENKENEKSQKLIDEISALNNEYDKLQITLEDIKAQHPESFKNQ